MASMAFHVTLYITGTRDQKDEGLVDCEDILMEVSQVSPPYKMQMHISISERIDPGQVQQISDIIRISRIVFIWKPAL